MLMCTEGHHFGVRMFDDKILSSKRDNFVRGLHILLHMIGPRCFLACMNAYLSIHYGLSGFIGK